MFWTEKILGTHKPIIGMCHLQPLPNDPLFDTTKGINFIIEKARNDINILQNEGINGILFSNEFSYPYSQKVAQVTVATMARVLGELKNQIQIPYGVDCMYDAFSTIDLAIATDADFYRVTLRCSSLNDYNYGITELGDLIRYAALNKLKAKNIINIDSSVTLSIIEKNTRELIKAIIIQAIPDSLSISAKTIDKLLVLEDNYFSKMFKDVNLICDGSCDTDNIIKILNYTNGVVVGTALKENKKISNPISRMNVKSFINTANSYI